MKNNKSIFTNQLASAIGKEAVDIQDDIEMDTNDLESQIKEARLCLESILNTNNKAMRESLLDTFLECLIVNKKAVKIKIDNNADFKQFDKIAELIEDEMNRFGYPKDLARFDVINLISSEIESVGIQINSDEGLEFIDFLKARWKC